MRTPRPAHHLKTWPEYFGVVKAGHKMFEIRRADRDFKVTDAVVLKEWCPIEKKFTGNEVAFRIAYIMEAFEGLREGYCAMTIRPIDFYLPGDVVKVPERGSEIFVVIQVGTGPEGKSGSPKFCELQHMENGQRLFEMESNLIIA